MNKWRSLLMNVHIHPLLWILGLIAVMTAQFQSLLVLFWIVVWHELGHVVAAHLFSWRIRRILLLPFGGVAEMDEHGNCPAREELLVTLAGPLQHVVMFLFAYVAKESGFITHEWYVRISEYNVAIFLMNLLPIWPLDGGKLLFLYLTTKTAFSTAHERMIYASTASLVLLIFALLVFAPLQINMWMIVLFLIYSLFQEWRYRPYVWIRFLLERYYGKKVVYYGVKRTVVDAHTPLFRVLLLFQRGKKHMIIVRKNGAEVELDENELLHVYFHEKRTSETIGDIAYIY